MIDKTHFGLCGTPSPSMQYAFHIHVCYVKYESALFGQKDMLELGGEQF